MVEPEMKGGPILASVNLSDLQYRAFLIKSSM
jgi:hypothetical protein